MELSADLLKRFVHVTNDKEPKKKETTVYGTVVKNGESTYVKLDGSSNTLTPAFLGVCADNNDRVIVNIKNHSATITNNLTSPPKTGIYSEILNENFNIITGRIASIEMITSKAITTDTLSAALVDAGYISAEEIHSEYVRADELVSKVAAIDSLTANDAFIKNIQTVAIDADYIKSAVADIGYLTADSAIITSLQTDKLNTNELNAKVADLGYLTADSAIIANLETNKLNTSDLNAENAKLGYLTASSAIITSLQTDKLDTKSLSAEVAKLGYLTADSATITNLQTNKLNTSELNAKVADLGYLTAKSAVITSLQTDKLNTNELNAKVADLGYLTADSAVIKGKLTASELNSEVAKLGYLTANSAVITSLQTDKLNAKDLNAEVAKLGYLTADNAVITGKLDANQLSAEVAKLGYAKVDFSNVGSQVVDSSMIKDGAVTNEKVANLSANKITSGTIDASKINVTNLNADNLTVGTINGQRIGNGSLSLDKLSEEVPTKEYLDKVQNDLQGQIDGAIETFTKTEIPTLTNEPANDWTDDETRKKHIGDICYVVNPTSSADGYCYRFADLGTNGKPNYSWVLIKDSDVTKALQDIIDINGEITGIKQFDTEISSWKTNTDAELSSLKTRTTTLETDLGTKVETSVFNELKQTVDENSSSITSLSTTVSKKADSSTVTDLINTVNSVKQTADKNTSSISSMQTTISGKADNSTVTALSNKTSELEQSLNGFKTTVSDTYATKTALNAVDGKFANYSTTTQMNSAITQKANEITSNVSATYTTKEEFNNLEIGGRNLLKPNVSAGHNTISNTGRYDIKLLCNNNSDTYFWINTYEGLIAGETYTLSCVASGLKDGTNWDFPIFNQGSGIPLVIKNGKCSKTFVVPSDYNGVTYVILDDLNRIWDNEQQNNPVILSKFKLEKGNKATDWTPAPEDVENEITSVQTVATQTANKFNWLVKSGTSATDFTLTDRVATLVANDINLNGRVTFSGLSSDAQNKITTAENTANTANTNASNALNTANSANTTANSASSTAKGIIDNIYTPSTTTIDGGKITTGTITAAKIAAGTITSNEIAAGTITADKINLNDLFAQNITATGTITGATLEGTKGRFSEFIVRTEGKENHNYAVFGINEMFAYGETTKGIYIDQYTPSGYNNMIDLMGQGGITISVSEKYAENGYTELSGITLGIDGTMKLAKNVSVSSNGTFSSPIIYENGTALSNKYAPISHSHDDKVDKWAIAPTDLDNAITPGCYRVNSGHANSPSAWGQLLVIRGGFDTITQIYGDYSTGKLFTRSGNPSTVNGIGTWYGWYELISSNTIGSQSVNYATSSGNAVSSSRLTTLDDNDKASNSDTWRRVWISYYNNTEGRPAWTDNLTFQTSTNTLKTTNFEGNLIGNATSSTALSSEIANDKLPYRLQSYHTSNVADTTSCGFNYVSSGNPFGTGSDFMTISQGYNYTWGSQIATDFRSNNMAVRCKNNGTWSDWATVITDKTIGSQSVNYATNSGNADTVDGHHASDFAAASHTHSYIESKGNYTFDSSTLPKSFDYGISAGFVHSDSGFGSFGSVLTVRTYDAGGGTLQLYAPYSPKYGGTHLKARFGDYGSNNGNSWTNLKEIAWVSDIPTNNNQLTNGAGYITSSGSCNYANSAGSAPASDVYSWAKQSTKPSYALNEITGSNNIFKIATYTYNAVTITGGGASAVSPKSNDIPSGYTAVSISMLNTGTAKVYARNFLSDGSIILVNASSSSVSTTPVMKVLCVKSTCVG